MGVIAAPCSKTSALLFIKLAHNLENPTTVPLSNWDTKNLRKLWEKNNKGRHACCQWWWVSCVYYTTVWKTREANEKPITFSFSLLPKNSHFCTQQINGVTFWGPKKQVMQISETHSGTKSIIQSMELKHTPWAIIIIHSFILFLLFLFFLSCGVFSNSNSFYFTNWRRDCRLQLCATLHCANYLLLL